MDTSYPDSHPKPAYVHTLSLRLTDEDYRRLRKFVSRQEERLGRRLTHQAVLEAALHQFLEREPGAAVNAQTEAVTAVRDPAVDGPPPV